MVLDYLMKDFRMKDKDELIAYFERNPIHNDLSHLPQDVYTTIKDLFCTGWESIGYTKYLDDPNCPETKDLGKYKRRALRTHKLSSLSTMAGLFSFMLVEPHIYLYTATLGLTPMVFNMMRDI